MKREWKPGDVALVEAGCWANRKVALRLDEGWAHTNGINVDVDGVVSAVRPLVVIDPDSVEQMESLAKAYYDLGDDWFEPGPKAMSIGAYRMQAALRGLITPPKPDEPTGLGAVVEDEDGDVWVHDRDRNPGYLGVEWLNVRTQAHRHYESITAVRILSEGVQPC